MYAVCLWIWHFNIKFIKKGKKGYFDVGEDSALPAIPGGAAAPTPTIYPIHYLMTVLLTLKFCTLLFESIRYHYLRVLGHARFFSFVYYIFTFVKGMTLFTGKSLRNRKTLEDWFRRSKSFRLDHRCHHFLIYPLWEFFGFPCDVTIILHSNSHSIDWFWLVVREAVSQRTRG